MRYHFDVSGLGATTTDVEGQEIGTAQEMRAEAGKVLAEIALHHLRDGGEVPLGLEVAVRVGSATVARARLTLAIEQSF